MIKENIEKADLLHQNGINHQNENTGEKSENQNSSLQPIRIIAASGSFDNLNEVADWLGVSRHTGLYKFDKSYRPVPITKQCIGYRGTKNPFVFENGLNNHILELIRDYSNGKPVLIFCST